jgi:hypothetical protein
MNTNRAGSNLSGDTASSVWTWPAPARWSLLGGRVERNGESIQSETKGFALPPGMRCAGTCRSAWRGGSSSSRTWRQHQEEGGRDQRSRRARASRAGSRKETNQRQRAESVWLPLALGLVEDEVRGAVCAPADLLHHLVLLHPSRAPCRSMAAAEPSPLLCSLCRCEKWRPRQRSEARRTLQRAGRRERMNDARARGSCDYLWAALHACGCNCNDGARARAGRGGCRPRRITPALSGSLSAPHLHLLWFVPRRRRRGRRPAGGPTVKSRLPPL